MSRSKRPADIKACSVATGKVLLDCIPAKPLFGNAAFVGVYMVSVYSTKDGKAWYRCDLFEHWVHNVPSLWMTLDEIQVYAAFSGETKDV